ncbi:MAG: AAA family ATPase [Campylobacterales bacterium]|nr:AAA family ATPase [Campylobacterales bacterium]
MTNTNIILIGFMGVGKGTIARALVKRSDYFAVDTDDLIESLENTKIKKIFIDRGEPYFRALEKRCALWCEKHLSHTIISTGGGFYRQENLKAIGYVVYLKASFESIIKRLEKSPNSKAKFKKRPLLSDMKEAKKLYASRVTEYERVADLVIDVESFDEDKIALEILQKVATIKTR